MSDLEELTRDYSREPVPDDHVVSGVRIALIVIGFAITLPVLLAGSEIGLALGLARSVKTFLIGGAVLAFVGCVTAYIGAKTRLSTYMITQFSFGVGGARVVNLLIAITLFGWYGVTAFLFGQAAQSAVIDIYGVDLGATPYTVLGSLLMVLTTVWGFKALDKLSLFAVPLMVAFLVAVVWYALKAASWEAITSVQGSGMSEGVATSLVVGSYIVGSILLPDLTRYSRQARDGIVAAFIALGIAFPGIFLVATIPSLAIGNKDLVAIMMGLGMGVPALAMIIFATWTSNANNLYSTSLTLATIFTRYEKWKITVAAGLLGTVLAALGIMDYFVNFLLFLGICIPPIAGIYIADFFFLRHGDYRLEMLSSQSRVNKAAFAAWLMASLIGYGSAHDLIPNSSIPACDSMAAAFVLYLVLKKLPFASRLKPAVGR
ncbi:MAG: cytosine permease [Sphingomonadales bacterium]|nr:cytosine permease [Sphingomonadales bacterium]